MFKKLLAIITLSTAFGATSALAQQQVEGGFWVDGFEWDRGSSTTLIVYIAINNGGTIALCGSYYTDGVNRNRQRARSALGSFVVETSGHVLSRDLRFLKEVYSEADLGQDYECRNTGVPWFEGANDNIVSRVTRRNF